MATELPPRYSPSDVEGRIYRMWEEKGYFHAETDPATTPYCIMIPPPNVTDRLHVGHALNNTLQDALIRFHRMRGRNTLWMPGTDHAGIATQTVVEKRILAEEGKRRTDFEREAFVARIQEWKDEYKATITKQLKMMGCSCDWARQRFTMDDVCARAVRETFFRLFKDGLIYRGKRLVNWDPETQTVLADDEVEHEEVRGHFWYMQYPLEEPVEVACVAGIAPACLDGDAGILPACPEGVSPSQENPIDKRMGRYLPHWTQTGATYAVTFRLADSVPAPVAEEWRRERQRIVERAEKQGRSLRYDERVELNRLFCTRIDGYLDARHGECLLEAPGAAETVLAVMRHFDCDRYDLIAWAIMPNHVHAALRPTGANQLADILHSWKSFSAKQLNRLLGRSGTVWMEEYYDHLIRDGKDFVNQVNYILDNPQKGGLHDYPWVGFKYVDRGQDGRDTRGQDARDTAGDTRGGDTGRETITYITVATTRPETMLGDTAVAMNPKDPRAEALVGKMVRLPIVGRLIPIIPDEHVVLPDPESDDEKARFSTGFLKVTPAHDPDDYEICLRHKLPIVNVLAPDGTISDKHGWDDADEVRLKWPELIGMDRFEARDAIVEWFRNEDLLEDVRDYVHEIGYSYRSHVPIEPYLSDQWYIAVKKPIPHLAQAFGEGLIDGTDVPLNSLAGLALKPLLDGRLRFTPDRYAKTYQTWLENLRDWPISRQLWWGHRIPVWRGEGNLWGMHIPSKSQDSARFLLPVKLAGVRCFAQRRREDGRDEDTWYVCPPPGATEAEKQLDGMGFQRDPDVLDTWFSSALWPFSTLGWPDDSPMLDTFYPGDLLCTAREIITLWVSRMVMMGQYCVGDIPFPDVFIHAMIQDGEGRKMSKSLGNGIDPLDIIDSHGADAMRFTLLNMTTQTQDVRMPVEHVTLADGRTVNTSQKFDIGRNFANKLWNAARFALMNLEGGAPCVAADQLEFEDRWILSRRNRAVRAVSEGLRAFRFNDAAHAVYDFAWHDFCDWYLEIVKPRLAGAESGGQARAVLALVLDSILRLLHPFMPFVTEELWQHLGEAVPARGVGEGAELPENIIVAHWPQVRPELDAPKLESDMESVQSIIRAVRNIRSKAGINARDPLEVLVASTEAATRDAIEANRSFVEHLGNISKLSVAESIPKPKHSAAEVVGRTEVFVPLEGLIDLGAERSRLEKKLGEVRSKLDGVRRKLGNESFTTKAPAEVVERERSKAADLEAQAEALERNLAELL